MMQCLVKTICKLAVKRSISHSSVSKTYKPILECLKQFKNGINGIQYYKWTKIIQWDISYLKIESY